MVIWRRGSRADDGPSPIEQQVIDDLAAPSADPDALIGAALAQAATHAEVARRRADQVIVGFTLGADLDALVADIERFGRTGADRVDLLEARRLDARAVRLGNQALAQQREQRSRSVTGLAALYLTTRPGDATGSPDDR
jgi:hypothetical protein